MITFTMLITYPLRRKKIKDHLKIITCANSLEKQKAEYNLLCYLINEFHHNRLLLREQREILLPRATLLHKIGALDKFHKLLEELQHLKDEFQYKFMKFIYSSDIGDFIGMKTWLLQMKKDNDKISDMQKLQILINLVFVNANQYNEEETTSFLEELEFIIINKGIVVYEGVENLMQEYECRNKEDKVVKLLNHIEHYSYKSWDEFKILSGVLYCHYQRMRNIEKQQEVVRNIARRVSEFNLSKEEKLFFEINLLRLFFESKMGEWELYSINLFRNRQRYLTFSSEMAFTFAEQFMAISKDSKEIYNRVMDGKLFKSVAYDIICHLKAFIEDIELKMTEVSDDFLYQKIHWLQQKNTFIRIEATISYVDVDWYKFYMKIKVIQRQILTLCKKHENNKEYLHWLLCFADDTVTLLAVENIKENDKENIKEEVKKMAKELKAIIEGYNNSPNVAYYMLFLANIYDCLGEKDEARNMLSKYDNTEDNYRVYSMSVQKMYIRLEIRYNQHPKDPNVQLIVLNNDLKKKNKLRQIKEALIIVNDKIKEINLDGKVIPMDISLEALLHFVCTCALIYLNGEQLDNVIKMADLFNQYTQDWKGNPSLSVEMGVIEAKAYDRKSDYIQAIEILEKVEKIARTDEDHFKVKYAKGTIQSKQANLDIKINSLSEALGIAEKMGNMKHIADVYEKLSLALSIKFPALGLSLLRSAEKYYFESGNEFAIFENKLLMAQSYTDIHIIGHPFYGTDTVYFKNEGRRILQDISYDKLTRASDKAFYNHVFGVSYNNIDKLWDSFNTYKELGDLSEAAKAAEAIAIIGSQIGNFEEAIKGELAHLEIAKNMEDQNRINLINQAIKVLEHKWIIEFPHKLPNDEPQTLLHILDKISFEEERSFLEAFQQKKKCFNPNDDGKCIPILDKNGSVSLFPLCRIPFQYYRGQSKQYVPCKPALYRDNMTPSKKYLERVRYAEFHLLIDTHPICEKYINFDKVLRPKSKKTASFNLYHLALAQHYGIATELIDLTADKWVAAFFAATDYVDGEYKVHTSEKGQGVFYVCKEPNYNQIEDDFVEPIIKPIGIQPFSRPGEQRGYAYPIAPEENFEDKVQTVMVFNHNSLINELIFNFANRSKRLFPEDVLKSKADVIKNSLTFSEAAYRKAQHLFYKDKTQKQFDEWEKAENMQHNIAPISSFTQKDMENFHKNYPVFEEKLLKNIINLQNNL